MDAGRRLESAGGHAYAHEAGADRNGSTETRSTVAGASRPGASRKPGSPNRNGPRARLVRRSRTTQARAGRGEDRYDSGSRSSSAPQVRDREEAPQKLDRVVFHPLASQDVQEAFRFYESRGANLSFRLLEDIAAALARLATYPESAPSVRGGTRRRRLARFPYSVLYYVEDDSLQILAVMHESRDPRHWNERH